MNNDAAQCSKSVIFRSHYVGFALEVNLPDGSAKQSSMLSKVYILLRFWILVFWSDGPGSLSVT